MVVISKYYFVSFVIILLAVSLLIVKPVNGEASPAIPKLSLKIVEYMEGGGLEITVQNQPLIANGHDTAGIFYDFRYKWHESTDWYHLEPDPAKWERQYIGEIGTAGVTQMVSSPNSYYEVLGNSSSHLLDYQVRAINGYLNETVPNGLPIGLDPNDTPVVVVNTSEWSDTVTIALTDYTPITSTPSPTSSTMTPSTIQPTTPSTLTGSPIPSNNFATIEIMLGVITVTMIVIAVLLLLLLRKK